MTQSPDPPVPAAYNAAPIPPLAYATPGGPRVGPRAWAGTVILMAAVALVGLGGCFLIGVMSLVDPYMHSLNGNTYLNPAPLRAGQIVLTIVLYLLAFVCFGGAALLFFLGTRGLLRVMRG